MAIDRAEALKKAEKLLRTGKLDLAIAEYLRLVEDYPKDWAARNSLGDLFVRAGQLDKAVAQYAQIADHLLNEGFLPRAAALYRKILKIAPDQESVLLQLAEISATQGLLADAKGHFTSIAARRRARGDRAGADEITVRLGTLDPSDFDARVLAAQTLAQNGDPLGAARLYRTMHADLLEKGRAVEAVGALREAVRYNPEDVEGRVELAKAALADGDLSAAGSYLDRATAGDDPALLLALIEIELRAGRMDGARETLSGFVRRDAAGRSRVVELAWTLATSSPEGAFVCIDTVVDAELAAGNYMDAAAVLQEFVTRVSGQIGALLKLVEICVDGGLEATMYETQAHLADAYLERGQGAEARVIAEDLVAREPWEPAHIDRFRRALVMLDVPDPDSLIADRLSGQGPFVATDPFMAPESFGEPEEPVLRPAGDREQPVGDAAPPAEVAAPAEEAPSMAGARRPPPGEPDIPLRPRAAAAAEKPPTRQKAPEVDIDLSQMLTELQGVPAEPETLEEAFADRRSEASREQGAKEAAKQLTLARTYLEMGMTEEAIGALTRAAKVPAHRFEAGALLGRIYIRKNDAPHAIEWLERAAQAPAPTPDEGRALFYDLGVVLDLSGETSRALAVFMELQADAGDYKDVAARIQRLSRVQTGG